jgi:hypothetical protein
MPIKTFKPAWIGIYNKDVNSYHGGSNPMSIGGVGDRHTFIGIPAEVRTALKESRTTPELRLKFYVTDNIPLFKFGGHKDTYNKAGGGLPWFKDLRQLDGVGLYWQSVNLTYDFMNAYMSGTYQGVVLHASDPRDYNYGEAFGITSGSNSAYFEVTGDWNDPPSKPSITYPQGGEIIDTEITVKWNKSTDAQGDTITYQLGISNGTGGWIYKYTTSNSYTIDTSDLAEQTNARIAIRALDDEDETLGFVYSNYFTISHNKAPTAPTSPSPANGKVYDRTQVIRFSWIYNDDGGNQAGYQLAWRTVAEDGTRGVWNYLPSSGSGGFANTTAQYYNMPANTLPAGKIEWAVRTKDQDGLTSPWSVYQVFTASNPSTAPIITTPEGGTWNSPSLEIEWSSVNQAEYEVYVYDSTGATLYHTAGTGLTKSVYPNITLESGKTYGVWVKTKNSIDQTWSPWSSVTITTAFTPPYNPILKRFEEAGEGVVNVFYASSDTNMLPDFLINNGEQNPKVSFYSVDNNESVTITGNNSYTVNTVTGQYAGLEVYLDELDIPIIEGARYRLSADSDVAGVRVYLRAIDENGSAIDSSYNPASSGSTPVTHAETSFLLPVGTKTLKAVFYNTIALEGQMNVFNCSMTMDNTVDTESIEIFRREYSSSNDGEWTRIGKDLSTIGSFLDYTPASGILYEYKVRAISTDGTYSDSRIVQAQIDFNSTLLQLVSDYATITPLRYCTTRELDMEIENGLMTFAGRAYPVREYGEHESITLQVDWEVDDYYEVRTFRQMLQAREMLLYRDNNGRRYFVTSGKLKTKDKPVNGFEMSIELDVTSYKEDI